jgi:hypothetical protein
MKFPTIKLVHNVSKKVFSLNFGLPLNGHDQELVILVEGLHEICMSWPEVEGIITSGENAAVMRRLLILAADQDNVENYLNIRNKLWLDDEDLEVQIGDLSLLKTAIKKYQNLKKLSTKRNRT